MKSLSETWFSNGDIDYELKKYTLLAYLQEVNRFFDANKLYPMLADVIFHYNNLILFKENKSFLQKQFPKNLTGVEKENLKLLYEQMMRDDEIMRELEAIVHFAEGAIKHTIENGTEIYRIIEDRLTIEPIGIQPLDVQDGYFFLRKSTLQSAKIFRYQLSVIYEQDEKYKSIRTEFIEQKDLSLVYTYNHIKNELIRNNKSFFTPAVYSIEIPLDIPTEETFLPIAKRSLVRYISKSVA